MNTMSIVKYLSHFVCIKRMPNQISLLIYIALFLCYSGNCFAFDRLSNQNKLSDKPKKFTALSCGTWFYDICDESYSKLFTFPNDEDLSNIRQRLDEYFYSDTINELIIDFTVDTNGLVESNQHELDSILNSISFPIFSFLNKPIKSNYRYVIIGTTVEQVSHLEDEYNSFESFFEKVGIKDKDMKKGFSFVCHLGYNGYVDDIYIIKSLSKKKDKKIREWLKEIRFTPGRKNGMPCDTWFIFDSNYYLNNIQKDQINKRLIRVSRN